MEAPRYCKDCKYAYRSEGHGKYLRCTQSPVKDGDRALCGEMRKGECGNEGKLWEPA